MTPFEQNALFNLLLLMEKEIEDENIDWDIAREPEKKKEFIRYCREIRTLTSFMDLN